MKFHLLFLFVLLFSAFSKSTTAVSPFDDASDLELFNSFQERFDVSYPSEEELHKRFLIFQSNLQLVQDMNLEHRQKGGTDVFGITRFMDLTPEEFKAKYLINTPFPDPRPVAPVYKVKDGFNPSSIPANFDWSSKDVLTAVKNQLQCGSCWAFSATEQVESMWALSGQKLIDLAPQQLVDCDTTDGGCNGGWPYNAYAYLISAGGQETEANYPYTAENGQCAFKPSLIAAKINGWQWVSQSQSTENTAMLDYVYNSGPVSVCVDASAWQYYQGGVLRTCTTNVDHCVQVTGFSEIDGIPAWNVRNSWGQNWGNNGSLYVERGSNLCLIATYVTTVTI